MQPRYSRSSPVGYCLGSFTVSELLRHRPTSVKRVVLASELPPERRAALERASEAAGVEPESDDRLLAALSHRSDVDAMATFEKFRDELDWHDDHLVLVGPRNPGNLGTILRSAAAFGVRDVALIGGGADPFSPHVLRASIGARFALRVSEFERFEEYRARRPGRIHLFTGDAAAQLPDVRFPVPFTLLFGPEWPGLPPELRSEGTAVAIPQAAAVESLSLPVAVGIALYTARHAPTNR